MTRPERNERRSLLGRVASGASDRMLDLVDPNTVLDHVDVEALLDRVDVNQLLDRVDVNDLLDRVDVNQLLDRVDVNQLLDRVDVNVLMDKVDVDALMARVDVEDLVERAGIPDIVLESTSHLTGSALDLFRRPLVGLDEIVFRGLNRAVGRRVDAYPEGPGDLIDWVEEHREDREGIKTGRYGGPLTRLLAVIIDSAVVSFGFTLVVAAIVFVLGLVVPDFEAPEMSGIAYGVGLLVFSFFYLWVSYAVFGKTIGKTIMGLRVVSADGHATMSARQPLVRVLTYPLSFVVFGIGLLGVVFNPQRQAWHDRFARTAVVYDWGSRAATMPTPLADFLERRGARV
jgi:uncharacterized RDD family membrane protein YckC